MLTDNRNIDPDLAAVADAWQTLPEAVRRVEADERKIIGLCQSKDFTPEKLKDLYKQIRPGTY